MCDIWCNKDETLFACFCDKPLKSATLDEMAAHIAAHRLRGDEINRDAVYQAFKDKYESHRKSIKKR